MFSKHVVLLALEDKAASAVLQKLKEISPFNGTEWEFRICGETKQLLNEPVPGILVLSRLLPGVESVLGKVRKRFGKARTVFLIDRVNERGKAFMYQAKALGFASNFVTGELPGDRPYSLPVALLQDYGEVVGQNREMEEEGEGAFGKVAVLGNLDLAGFSVVKIGKEKKVALDIDAVLIQRGYSDAARRIRVLRRGGYSGPILIYGGYDTALIAAGATGSVQDAKGLREYLSLVARERRYGF